MTERLDLDEIKHFIDIGMTYEDISDRLRSMYPNDRGLSARSVRRFCKSNKINRNCTLSQSDKNKVVLAAIDQVNFDLLICSFFVYNLGSIKPCNHVKF